MWKLCAKIEKQLINSFLINHQIVSKLVKNGGKIFDHEKCSDREKLLLDQFNQILSFDSSIVPTLLSKLHVKI
jgi:hypothetical protein